MTTAHQDDCQDDWCQRLKENPDAPLEEIRQLHEAFLNDLEGLAVYAIASNNWDAFYAHVVDFQNEHDLHGESGIAMPTAVRSRDHRRLRSQHQNFSPVRCWLLLPNRTNTR